MARFGGLLCSRYKRHVSLPPSSPVLLAGQSKLSQHLYFLTMNCSVTRWLLGGAGILRPGCRFSIRLACNGCLRFAHSLGGESCSNGDDLIWTDERALSLGALLARSVTTGSHRGSMR